MKKLLFLTCLGATIIFSSCSTPNSTKTSEQFVKGSINSTENHRLDSLSLIAWGDAKFGMSTEEVLMTNTFANAEYEKVDNRYDRIRLGWKDLSALREAMNLKRSLFELKANFDNGELFQIVIEINGTVWENYEAMVVDAETFTNRFSEKYGMPVSHVNPKYVTPTDFQRGTTYALFKIKSKEIRIKLQKDRSTGYPTYGIYISNSDFPRNPYVKNAEDLQKEQEIQEKEQSERELIQKAL